MHKIIRNQIERIDTVLRHNGFLCESNEKKRGKMNFFCFFMFYTAGLYLIVCSKNGILLSNSTGALLSSNFILMKVNLRS